MVECISMISDEIKGLCAGFNPGGEGGPEEPGPYISVEQLTGRFGALYEKVRSLVDYKDYHVIRRSAIRRMLKRQLYIERKPNSGAALLKELVSRGYLPNNKVPEAKAIDLQNFIHKWMAIEHEGLSISLSLDFASIEIERFLFPDQIKDLMVESFYKAALPSVVYQGKEPVDHDAVTYAACRRSLFSEDKSSLLYSLAVREIPELSCHACTDPMLMVLSRRLSETLLKAEHIAKHPLVWKVSARLKNH